MRTRHFAHMGFDIGERERKRRKWGEGRDREISAAVGEGWRERESHMEEWNETSRRVVGQEDMADCSSS